MELIWIHTVEHTVVDKNMEIFLICKLQASTQYKLNIVWSK